MRNQASLKFVAFRKLFAKECEFLFILFSTNRATFAK